MNERKSKCPYYQEYAEQDLANFGIIKYTGRCENNDNVACSCMGNREMCDFYSDPVDIPCPNYGQIELEAYKIMDMSFKELVEFVIDKISEKRNINALFNFGPDGNVHLSVYPYEEEEENT